MQTMPCPAFANSSVHVQNESKQEIEGAQKLLLGVIELYWDIYLITDSACFGLCVLGFHVDYCIVSLTLKFLIIVTNYKVIMA